MTLSCSVWRQCAWFHPFVSAHSPHPFFTHQRGKISQNLFLNLTKNHLILLNRSKRRADKHHLRAGTWTSTPTVPAQILSSVLHHAANWSGALSFRLLTISISPFWISHLTHRELTSRTANLVLFHLFQDLHCCFAARKNPGVEISRSIPIHHLSVTGSLVPPFLVFIFLSDMTKRGKIYSP